ncbi:MAG TPA: hypothetical protein VGK34_00935 [Armatimonadota bacterium]
MRRLLAYGVLAVLFCFVSSSARAAEIQLLGIKLGSPGMRVLQKYGNPNEIRVGGATAQATGGQTGIAARPGAAGMMPGAQIGGRQGMAGARMPGGMPGAGLGMPGGMPGAGLGMPGALPAAGPGMAAGPRARAGAAGMPGMPGLPGRNVQTTQSGTQVEVPTGTPVVWVYRFSDNRSVEINLNPDGIVMQIAIYGATWKGQRTAKGITLGSMYKEVLKKYGYPESHEQQGIQLLLKYPKRDRVVFTTVGRSVVGITIALQ